MRTGRRMVHWMVMVLALASAGCNTIKGVGKDLQHAGQTIENAAKK